MPMPNLGFGRRTQPIDDEPQWGTRPEVDYGGMSPDTQFGAPDDYGNMSTIGDSMYGPEPAKKKGWRDSKMRGRAKKGLAQFAAMTASEPLQHYKFRTPGLLSGGM